MEAMAGKPNIIPPNLPFHQFPPHIIPPLPQIPIHQSQQPHLRQHQFSSYLQTLDDVSPVARTICKILKNSPADAIEAALSSAGIKPSPEIVEEVLKLSYGCPPVALKFFRWAGQFGKNSAVLWNLIVDLLGKNCMFEPMWDAVRSMKKEELLSIDTFVLIFESYCVAGRVSEAFMTFDVMEKYGILPNVVAVNSLLSAICKGNNQTFVALEFFERIKNKIPPNVDSFAILLEGLEKEGNLVLARTTFGEMLIRFGWSPQNKKANETFSKILVRELQFDEAFKFLVLMKKTNCLPGLKFFSASIDVLIRMNDLNRALLLWDIMVGSGLVPNLIMYNAMIDLLCHNNDIDNALFFLDVMVFDGAFPDSSSYNMIFQCLIKNKRVHEAGKFFCEMIKNEWPPMHSICASAISMLFEGDDPEAAIEIWEYMKENNILPLEDSSNALLIGLCNMGRLSDLSSFAENMLDRKINIYQSTMLELKNAFYKDKTAQVTYDNLLLKWNANLSKLCG